MLFVAISIFPIIKKKTTITNGQGGLDVEVHYMTWVQFLVIGGQTIRYMAWITGPSQ